MKNQYGQYPEIYSKDNTRYTYFFDNGTRVTLIAGENGVTEEWIHALKLEHRKEYNMLRQGHRSKNTDGEDDAARVVSLDRYMDGVGDAGQALEDHTADVEGNYIAGIERAERREAIQKAFASLTSEQRDMLIRVKVKGISITSIAAEEKLARQAIQNRLTKIEDKIRKICF